MSDRQRARSTVEMELNRLSSVSTKPRDENGIISVTSFDRSATGGSMDGNTAAAGVFTRKMYS